HSICLVRPILLGRAAPSPPSFAEAASHAPAKGSKYGRCRDARVPASEGDFMVDTAQRRISGSLAAACFGVAVLAGFGAVTLTPVSPAAAAPAAIPDFAPNPNVGWVAFAPQFIPPPTGPGPVGDDPAHKRVSNDDYRARGAQPTFPIGDLNSPILQPWAKEQMRKYNERVLRGEPAYSRTAS